MPGVRVHAGGDVGDRDADLRRRVSVPVIDSSPTSLCTSRSYAFFVAYGPDEPYPETLQTISRG